MLDIKTGNNRIISDVNNHKGKENIVLNVLIQKDILYLNNVIAQSWDY